MTRVLVVEDHPLYRQAVARLVGDIDGWSVVGEFGEAEPAIEKAVEADLVVLDLGLPGTDGLSAIRLFQRANPDLVVVVLTMSEEATALGAAIRAGARGYLVKGSEPGDIVRALVGVARGQVVFGEQVAAAVLTQASAARVAAPFPGLTERETEVLDLVAAGRSNAEIADALFLSPKTVRNQVSSILTKLGGTRSEVIARARDAGLGAG
ncbi:DNA-binding response regulator [Nocardioides silvaticus]|uniref:DNA-binding response regulator n=1 Tax=Nocardioides silvaticus TaxID=2201891 RepID=A0A316TI78_9ACTN|nr:response regulator transcription factor [Nocardioides silvaticus]PWN03231.1 DNA-binding response regulator [Nocardioides silvaticus]